MQLSIIIPAFNEEKYIAHTIDRVKAAVKEAFEVGYAWELILCDNNSTDATVKIATDAGAKVVHEPVHQISKVRNRGASIAKGKFLLFIDADSYPSTRLIAELKEKMDLANCLGCGTNIEVVDGSMWNKLRMERLNPLMKGFNYAWGAFVLCHKEIFREIGGFSEDLFALEEIDFVRRLKKCGRKYGLKFHQLKTPVYTSGRKDELSLRSIFTLFISNSLAVLFLIQHSFLPKKWRIKGNSRFFGFWYKQGRGRG